jgi:hypothetical protein
MREAREFVAGTAAVLYALALIMPTYHVFNPRISNATNPGIDAFRIGWRALTAGEWGEPDLWLLSAAWLANPAIWVAEVAVACGWWRVAGLGAGCGLLLCLTVLLRFGEMVTGHPGFWAWSGSAAFLLVASVLAAYRGNRRQHELVVQCRQKGTA